jgi:hypothetical protein
VKLRKRYTELSRDSDFCPTEVNAKYQNRAILVIHKRNKVMKFVEYISSLLDIYEDEDGVFQNGLVDEADAIILEHFLDEMVFNDRKDIPACLSAHYRELVGEVSLT